jgi:hypothetical protein
MMRSGSVRKVMLFSQNEELKLQFLNELYSAGIPVESTSPSRSWNAVVQKSNNLILLNPPYEELVISDTSKLNQRAERYMFIVTDDERWKQQADARTVFYLPVNTHPLELARLLVEKLNLPAVSNKPAYAFSFFQF